MDLGNLAGYQASAPASTIHLQPTRFCLNFRQTFASATLVHLQLIIAITINTYIDNLDLVINYANTNCESAPIPLIVCTIYYPLFDEFLMKTLAGVGLYFINGYHLLLPSVSVNC